jgi:hypothetical protein
LSCLFLVTASHMRACARGPVFIPEQGLECARLAHHRENRWPILSEVNALINARTDQNHIDNASMNKAPNLLPCDTVKKSRVVISMTVSAVPWTAVIADLKWARRLPY